MTPPPAQPRHETGAYGPPMPYDQPRGLSITSMVIGLSSILLGLTLVVPIVGLVLGVLGLRREPAGRGFALAGIWINGVILALSVLAVVAFVVGFLIFGLALIPGIVATTTDTSNALG
jgi:hypothetical protein